MTPQDYEFIRKVLKDRSGLVLGPDKQYLLESRLLPVVRTLNASCVGKTSIIVFCDGVVL